LIYLVTFASFAIVIALLTCGHYVNALMFLVCPICHTVMYPASCFLCTDKWRWRRKLIVGVLSSSFWRPSWLTDGYPVSNGRRCHEIDPPALFRFG